MKRVVYIMVLAVLLTACNKVRVVPNAPPPAKAVLVFPELNALCTTGISLNATQSTVVFKWAAAENASSYDLVLKNLQTGELVTYSTPKTEFAITLLKGVPYSWYINSRSDKNAETAASDTWRFYNAGASKASYAPYPAEMVSPAIGQKVTATGGNITFTWNGADVDNDIVSYDLYVGTTTDPPLYKASIIDSKLEGVPVKPGSVNYWKVITHDAAGNFSDSGVFPFVVN